MTARRDSTERTPERHHRRERKFTASGFTWQRPEDVPGAVLSTASQRALAEHAQRWREHHASARVSGRSYVIYR